MKRLTLAAILAVTLSTAAQAQYGYNQSLRDQFTDFEIEMNRQDADIRARAIERRIEEMEKRQEDLGRYRYR